MLLRSLYHNTPHSVFVGYIYITLCVVVCRLLSWKLVTGLLNVPESSMQYANDNADLLASVSNECLDFTLI